MPAQIPVLKEGKQTVSVIAGIKKNGQASQRVLYPFYSTFEQELELMPAVVDTLKPIVGYRDACKFVWLEDFEDQTTTLVKSGSNSSVDSLKIIGDPAHVYAYDGVSEKFSSMGQLDTGFQIFEFSSTQLFDLPRAGADVYLEFNYKADVELIAGIYPINSQVVNGVPIVNFFPSTEWKKAYVSLTADINQAEYQGIDFRIFFGAFKTSGDTKANVYLDNIKLIHF